MNRRHFLQSISVAGTAGATALAGLGRSIGAEERSGARIRGFSACSWTLRDGSPGVFETARRIGLDGVEVDVGSPAGFTLDTAEKRVRYKEAARKSGLRVSSLAIGCLNSYPLKSDARTPGWVAQAIESAADFGVDVILLAFFGAGELKDRNEMMRVGDILKEVAPAAEKKKIRLGLENTLSARDSLAIVERSGSKAVQVYYDAGNSRHWGHDAPAELRMLGDRVCGVHFKDGVKSHGDTRLGEGKVDFPAVAKALHEIRYDGWITLESRAPDLVPDMQYSLRFARRVLGS